MANEDLYQLPKKSSAGLKLKVLGAYITTAFASFTAGTQYIAAQFNYDASLGATIFGHWYSPHSVISWNIQYYQFTELRDIMNIGGAIAMGGTILGALAAYGLMAYLQKKFDEAGSNLKGSAKWGTVKDAEKEGLLGENSADGVYVGAIQDGKKVRYLRHSGPEHVMVFAPTRSGKGVGLVIPTLLSWRHSAFILDIKGENWALTSGFRKAIGQTVLRLDPTNIEGNGARFNPLNEIRKGTLHEVKDVQNIVQMIVDPDGKGQGDHWAKTGAALLTAVILHILYSKTSIDKTLRGVASFLSDPARTIDETLDVMLTAEHIEPGEENTVYWKGIDPMTGVPTCTHPVVAQSARAVLNKSENERSGVLSTSLSFLELYRDPVVAENTSVSDFKIADLMRKDNPTSLYLVVPPSDKDRLKPFVRLIINQIVRSLTESMEFEGGRSKEPEQKLLLMIDEFPSLGKMEVLAEALAFIAGYGLKAYLITQDLSQLYAAYGKDEVIMGNCHIRIAYAPNKIETAELLSKMLGESTVQMEQNSYSGGRSSMLLGQMSSSVQETGRALLTPDECMRLPKDDMLLFIAGQDPIKGKKIVFYNDPTFSARSKMTAPVSDRIDTIDTKAPEKPKQRGLFATSSPAGTNQTPPPTAAPTVAPMPKPTPAPTAKPVAETVAAFDVDRLAATDTETDTDEAKATSNNVGSEVVAQETGEIITMPKTKHTVVKSQIDDLKGMF